MATKLMEKDYWIDVTVGDTNYHLGCDLKAEGTYKVEPNDYLLLEDPKFTSYVVFDPMSGDVLEDKTLSDRVVVAAQEHLCNVYWNEALA